MREPGPLVGMGPEPQRRRRTGRPANPAGQGQYGRPANPSGQGQYGRPAPGAQGQYGRPANPAGQGQYAGLLGALIVERPDGLRFRIGSGFSNAQRARPPAIGSQVTYRYNGLTDSGTPRFARFLRERALVPPPDPR